MVRWEQFDSSFIAWNYYNQFSGPYKRIGIAYIESVRNDWLLDRDDQIV
jgi:hypothetical protein